MKDQEFMVSFLLFLLVLFCTGLGIIIGVCHISPTIPGHYMVSGFDGDGTLVNTAETEKLEFDIYDNGWRCEDKNSGNVYFYPNNILIERIPEN